jgi:hypothetical protein
MTAGDYNKDGKLDLAVASLTTNTVTVLLGKGDGTFSAGAVVPTIPSPVGLLQADFNGDGNLDLLVLSDLPSTSYQVLLGSETGSFTAQTLTSPVSIQTVFLALADFNKDGLPDLILVNEDAATAEVLLNATTTTATATLSGAKVAGTGNQLVQAKYVGVAPYAASSSNSLSLAP